MENAGKINAESTQTLPLLPVHFYPIASFLSLGKNAMQTVKYILWPRQVVYYHRCVKDVTYLQHFPLSCVISLLAASSCKYNSPKYCKSAGRRCIVTRQ